MKVLDYTRSRMQGKVSADVSSIGFGAPFYEGQDVGSSNVNCYRLTTRLIVNFPLVIDGVYFHIPAEDDYSVRLVAGTGTLTTTVNYTMTASKHFLYDFCLFEPDEGRVLLLPGLYYYIQINCANQHRYYGAPAVFNGTYYSTSTTYYNTTSWGAYMAMYLRGYVPDFTFPFSVAKGV